MGVRISCGLAGGGRSQLTLAKDRQIATLGDFHQPSFLTSIGLKIVKELGPELPCRDAYNTVIGGTVIDGTAKHVVADKLLVNFLGVAAQGPIANIFEKVAET